MAEYVVGVDIGGTFTDCVVVDDAGAITLGKALSTPDDFALGAVNAVADAARQLGLADDRELLSNTQLFFHACTVAENTLLTRSGPRTGVVATAGFGETILMMRGRAAEGLTEMESAHAAVLEKPVPIVPRQYIVEVPERVDYKGAVVMELDRDAAERAIDALAAKGVESYAIALLWSIKNEVHERALGELLRERVPGAFYTLSCEVAPFIGEYERTATTVFNAYVGPTISAYLNRLQQTLRERGLKRDPLIMQAYGGVLGFAASAKNAVGMIESGPAAGVSGSAFQGALIDHRNILAADMGGTTFKVGVIRDGEVERDYNPVIMRYNILSTKIWVESIGAGGGSIAWIDPEAGLLKVGPQGAGAKPGPVCYALGGTEPTVSDADLILGYLNEDYFFGGRMRLDKAGAARALQEKVADPLGVSLIDVASGIYRVTNAHMADLVRRATVERGHDPRSFVLYAYGGAGPVHAGRYAAELGMKEIVIPPTSAVQGSLGLISSDVVYEFGMSDQVKFPPDADHMNRNFAPLIERARRELAAAGFRDEEMAIQRSLDMRYRFQTHELTVPLPPGDAPIVEGYMDELDALFDALYEQAYGQGSGYREAGKDIITFRVRGTGKLRKPRLKVLPLNGAESNTALKARRPVFFHEYNDFVSTPIYQFEQVTPGMRIAGPAVIESPITTIVVNPNDQASMDGYRNIHISIGG